MVISHWSPEFKARYGGSLPDSYLAFDVETSGFSRQNDVIVEWGHCLVRDRKVVDRGSFLVNWYAEPPPPAHYLDKQLFRIGQAMRQNGRTWRITPELLREKGILPSKFLPWLHAYLSEIKDQKLMFVSHNGVNFDAHLIRSQFRQDLGVEFDFGCDQVFDVGAVVKVSQMLDDPRILPRAGETMEAYFSRVSYGRAPTGVKWNLDDYCVERFDLVRKYNLNPALMHTAGEDAYALHGLMEELRQWTDQYELTDQYKQRELRNFIPALPPVPSRPPSVSPNPWGVERVPPPAPQPRPPAVIHRGQRNR